ncbi:MAG: hypothetical protein HYZ69_00250 [Candidatus Colwellbacteria bacterium]|nr:hypothetical protein [Candidatus Colwellbacteria bacterium]
MLMIAYAMFFLAGCMIGFQGWWLLRIYGKRHITVMILIDENSPSVQKYIYEMMIYFYEIVGFVSEVFQKEFNITFSIRDFHIQKFEQDAYGVRTDLFWRDIRYTNSLSSEIVVGFTENAISVYGTHDGTWKRADELDTNVDVGGIVDPKRLGGVLIRLSGNIKMNTHSAIHEVAHLFGARHTDSEEDTMYGGQKLALPLHFDSLNKTRIFWNKRKKFTKEMISSAS